MALMKTKRGGEPVKKTVEPQPKQYTWEDVSKNEEVKASNLAKRKQYESELDVYGKQIKAYKSQPKTRDMQTFFQGGGRYLSPSELESWNKEAEASGSTKERAGLKASKVYVSKGFGTEQAGGSIKGEGGRSYAGYKGAFHEWLGEPKKPTEGTYEKEEDIDIKKIPIPRMPQLKPGKIEGKSKKLATGKIESTPIEKSDWQDPEGGVRTKTRIVKPYQVKTGEYIGQNIKYGLQKLAGKEPILRPGVKKTKEALIQGRVGREASKAKAYFGAGFEGKSVSDIGEIQSSLKSSKSGLKEGIKEARKAGDREKVAAYKSAKKDVKSEIKQSKLASRYLKDLGQEYTGVKAGEKLARTGKVKAYTPESMAGFVGSKQDVYDKNAYNDRFLAKKKKSASK
jgi:hypothetical protein